VAGVTHGLNAVADGLRLPLDFSPWSRQSLVPLVEPASASAEVQAVFDDIRSFYALERPPAVFRYMARDVGFLQSYWAATREAFLDRKLDRSTKEILALAASLTAKSDYGVDLHLREARRLGLTDQGLTEAHRGHPPLQHGDQDRGRAPGSSPTSTLVRAGSERWTGLAMTWAGPLRARGPGERAGRRAGRWPCSLTVASCDTSASRESATRVRCEHDGRGSADPVWRPRSRMVTLVTARPAAEVQPATSRYSGGTHGTRGRPARTQRRRRMTTWATGFRQSRSAGLRSPIPWMPAWM
jgi:AhpD family alkylhydroperoxidase